MDNKNIREVWSSAFQRATWGCAPAIGQQLRISARAVQQWGEIDADKRSPGERLEIVMAVALEHRKRHDALAPLHLLAARFGYRLAPQEAEKAPVTPVGSLAQQASRAMIEAGEAVHTVLSAIEDEIISTEEREAIERECDEAIEAIMLLKNAAQRTP